MMVETIDHLFKSSSSKTVLRRILSTIFPRAFVFSCAFRNFDSAQQMQCLPPLLVEKDGKPQSYAAKVDD
jgi:hypothetical protein